MMSRQTWSSISVYDFFRTYNWTGKTIKLYPFNLTDKVNNTESLLFLSLREFFLQSNWTGKQVKKFISPNTNQSEESLFSLSVNDFFQAMVWKSSLNIAPNPNPSLSLNSIDSSSSKLDLDNLSDLF
ncbi:MAG: hypothetical protein QNJ37_03915 [Crocosphaera sp.]|nr:hypothetical protein [Crocosphaera sp.]